MSSVFAEQFSNWCEECGLTEEEKGPKGALASVKSHEVNLLVSSPRLASGSTLRENIQDFESLSERFTRVCEDAIFVHRVPAAVSCKTRPDEDDGFGQKAEVSEPCLAKSKTSIPCYKSDKHPGDWCGPCYKSD